uniref:Ribosomal protein L32 n=1 Tax=Pseudocodium devriesii TaxID=453070 RepID=A0A386B155_9CHLO|nr:ribosomal protein L32 [Pseudocodium devriesii]AYC65425.1 ribosomal protein L32 [Pseudocodium devriesii]
MAVPKKRTSKSKSKNRKTLWKKKALNKILRNRKLLRGF